MYIDKFLVELTDKANSFRIPGGAVLTMDKVHRNRTALALLLHDKDNISFLDDATIEELIQDGFLKVTSVEATIEYSRN